MPVRAQLITITEAVARAPGGARILISPGHYRESVVIDKPLELIGDGLRDDIIIETAGPEPLVFDTNIGVVRNLTLRQRQAKAVDYCIWIKQGRLELEDCDLSSTGLACLAVIDNADPRVRRNRIHDCKGAGIHVHDQGRGTFEDNELFGNAGAGIRVENGGHPTVRRNRIVGNRRAGTQVGEGGAGLFENNDLRGNADKPWDIHPSAEAQVKRVRNREQ
jgi:F-box protein 11